MIQQQFRAFVHVCTCSSHLVKNLELAMREEAESFAATRLAGEDVVAMYLVRQPSEKEAVEDLAVAFRTPLRSWRGSRPSGPNEICILAVPASPKRGQLRHLLGQAAPRIAADRRRQQQRHRPLPRGAAPSLAELEQFGPVAEAAYQQMNTAEHLTPHARLDITAWQ